MVFAGIAFLAGVLLAQSVPQLPGFGPTAAIAACGTILFTTRPLRLPALVAVGFAWTVFCAQWQLAEQLPAALEGERITVTGYVADLPESNARRVRFLFAIDTVEIDGEPVDMPLRVRLSWYGNHLPMVVGDHWRFEVRLKRPHGFSNPGGFDYEGWLFQKGIRATGYVLRKGDRMRLKTGGYRYINGRFRQYTGEKIDAAATGVTHLGTLRALAIGDRSGIDREGWRRLTGTGTNHLFAISGLHIGLISVLVYFLAARCWRVSRVICSRVSRQIFACGFAILGASFYAMMAGFALPTQRALIMLLVPAFAIMSRRRVPPLAGIGAALLLVLIFDPFSTLSPGFWLSFGAVGIIIFRLAGRVAQPGWLGKTITLQIAIAIGLSPFLLALFGQLPTASAIANLLAVPWVSLTVVPLTLLGVLFSFTGELVAGWCFQLADLAIGIFWHFLAAIESSELFPVVSLASTPAAVVFAGGGVALLLLPRGSGLRVLSVLLLLPLLTPAERGLSPGDLKVTVFDVGQGLSVLVETAGKALIYDTGTRFSASFNAGDAVIVPALKYLGVPGIDKLIISHSDLDHRGGLQALVRNVPVKEILSSDPGAIAVKSTACYGGQRWQWDEVQFDVLHPTDRFGHASTNNRSCVLRITTGGTSVLLPGDIELAAERELLSMDELRADILLVPHHGSNTSSTQEFVDLIRPEHAVFSVGYRNSFGFPKTAVERRYARAGATSWRTDRDGAIVFQWSADAGKWSAYSYRNKFARFWNDNPQRAAFTTAAE